MTENFTEQQREIVARKMGYSGPMQMFDEYLASTPSDAAKYAGITSKYVARMAKGGLITAKQMAQKLQSKGRGGDTLLAHINAGEAALLKSKGGSGTVNPETGLLEFETASSDAVLGAEDNFKAAAQAIYSNTATTAEQKQAELSNIVRSMGVAPETVASAFGVSVADVNTVLARNPATTAAATTAAPIVTTATVTLPPASVLATATSAPATTKPATTPSSTESVNLTTGVTSTSIAATTPAATVATTAAATATAAAFSLSSQPAPTAPIVTAVTTAAQATLSAISMAPVVTAEAQMVSAGYTPAEVTKAMSDVRASRKTIYDAAGVATQVPYTDAEIKAGLLRMGLNDVEADAAIRGDTFTGTVGYKGVTAPGAITAQSISAAAAQASVSALMATLSAVSVSLKPSDLAVAAQQGYASPQQVLDDVASLKLQGLTDAALKAQLISNGLTEAQATQAMAGTAPTGQLGLKTALSGLTAAQGTAATISSPSARAITEAEKVDAYANMVDAEAQLKLTTAAEGTVTADMTVQGQLNTLLKDFDAGKPPAWAASTMRSAMAILSARGLGASSMAGQAVIQAALEAATPIAAADAKVQETMALQNLSNKQATALELGRQRATFLGQVFDQTFQAKVLNAAKVSEIAGKNFDAAVTISIENARLANTMDVANLSSRNALVLANAAQLSTLETANLSNRQQVAVENAKAFLAMDLKDVDVKQQTLLFKAQTISNALLGDTSATNAIAATNATNKLDADKVTASLTLTADEFSSAERTKIKLADQDAANSLIKFNAEQANRREEFNSNMSATIDLASAKILADVSTANTRETNALTAVNAKNATDLSASTYAQLSTTYRDLLEMSFKAGDNEAQRLTELAKASISASATLGSAATAANASSWAALGGAALAAVKYSGEIKSAWDSFISLFH